MNRSIDILKNYPELNETETDRLLAAEISSDPAKIIVLDDDPTGVQTVHDVSVYTDWSYESIRSGFQGSDKVFYILTNSRGMTVAETTRVHTEIAERSAEISAQLGIPYMIMSRSDSTLRGHYPLETELLRESLERHGQIVHGEILTPFFKEGGRYTIDNIHYVKQGNELVPAAETEFAADKTFGYHHSSLPEYIEEKTAGSYPADSVTCIRLEDLRAQNYDVIQQQIEQVSGFNKIIVNAVDYIDLKVFAVALYRAIHNGRSFMFRTAAGLVKVMGGITDIPLLTRNQMITSETANGGIVVVGSHTKKTTAQLLQLLTLDCTEAVEFNSDTVLDGDDAFYAEVARCVANEEAIIRSGKTAVCFTKRTLLSLEDDTPESALIRSVKISDGVQKLVGCLKETPAFVIAKGGITSSDVGVKALCVKKALVMGQIAPGIPVWKTGAESRFPSTPYVIFPGNTGNEETLKQAVEILTK